MDLASTDLGAPPSCTLATDGAVSSAKRRILIVDDEPEVRRMLASYCRAEGYEALEAADGNAALEVARRSSPELVLLDVGLPGRDGFDVLAELRRVSNVPVIMLTARSEETDRVVGLRLGADDYVVKPFSPRELIARIGAVLRRTQRGDTGLADQAVNYAGLVIDVAGREVQVDGGAVVLSALEFDLLATLASAPGRVFTREQLLQRVWGWDYFGVDRVIDVHVANLRKALGDDATAPRFVGTVRGVGYKFLPRR